MHAVELSAILAQPTQTSYGVFDSPYAYVITARILAQEHGAGWQAALQACRKLALAGLPFTAAQISTLRSHLDQLAARMRRPGFLGFPSPVVTMSGAGFPSSPRGISSDSAGFLAAQRACWSDAPEVR